MSAEAERKPDAPVDNAIPTAAPETDAPRIWSDPHKSEKAERTEEAEAQSAQRAAAMAAARKRERRMFRRWAAVCWIASGVAMAFMAPDFAILDWRLGLHALIGLGLGYWVFGDLGWAALAWGAEYTAKHETSRRRLAKRLKWMRAFAYIGLGMIVYVAAKWALTIMAAQLPAVL